MCAVLWVYYKFLLSYMTTLHSPQYMHTYINFFDSLHEAF